MFTISPELERVARDYIHKAHATKQVETVYEHDYSLEMGVRYRKAQEARSKAYMKFCNEAGRIDTWEVLKELGYEALLNEYDEDD